MKKINNNLPRGGAEWGRALRRFLSDNIVPIMFVLICAYCIPVSYTHLTLPTTSSV